MNSPAINFGLRRQSASGDGAFETERRVRLVRPARSYHTLESGVALRLPPQSKMAEGVLDCAGRAPAATALSKRSGAFDWSNPLSRHHTLESGVALCLPPQSKSVYWQSSSRSKQRPHL